MVLVEGTTLYCVEELPPPCRHPPEGTNSWRHVGTPMGTGYACGLRAEKRGYIVVT